MNTSNFIVNIGLYLFVGLWCFVNNLQYKRNISLLLDNRNNELIQKIKQLESKIFKLEKEVKLKKNIKKKMLRIKEEKEEKEKIVLELTQMKIEDKNLVLVKEKNLDKILDDDLVDLSEEIYPTKNLNQNIQNKKGWLKTLLFM